MTNVVKLPVKKNKPARAKSKPSDPRKSPDRRSTPLAESDDPQIIPVEFREELHAEAFRDMEGEVCDIDRMAQIAQRLIMGCGWGEKSEPHDLELTTFAVQQMAKMAKEFRANYQKRWYGELKGTP